MDWLHLLQDNIPVTGKVRGGCAPVHDPVRQGGGGGVGGDHGGGVPGGGLQSETISNK